MAGDLAASAGITLRRMHRAMKRMFAAPGTMVGWLLSFTFDRRFRRDGILVAEGARWPSRAGWRFRAITLGRVVLCVDRIDEELWDHELVHVDQWERWGPLLAVAYPLASLAMLLRGRRAYRDNPFEVAARRGPARRDHQAG